MPVQPAPPQRAPGHPERLGKYTITGVLGEGAMGVVYKGLDAAGGRTVALKTIHRSLLEGERGSTTLMARFRNEAVAAARLAHPGIVAVHDFAEDGEVAFIAMEFVAGRTLAQLLAERGRLGDDEVRDLMCQLLDALHHAHERGVWHRDIKPANLIVTDEGRLKIADFGICRIENAALTVTPTLLGTPAYMAPEQFFGSSIDRRVDIYGAGVVLYVLLTGTAPFAGTREKVIYSVVHDMPLPPSRREGAQRPPWYDAIVARALAKAPAARYTSAAQFREAIERGGEGTSPSVPPPGSHLGRSAVDGEAERTEVLPSVQVGDEFLLREAHQRRLEGLGEPERLAFARLSVFRGGFDVEAAEQVLGAEPLDAAGVVDLLGALIDAALVEDEERGGVMRFRLLEPLRQHAADRLGPAELPALQRRHAEHYLQRAAAVAQTRGAAGAGVPPALAAEAENLRAAFDISLAAGWHDLAPALAAAIAACGLQSTQPTP